MAPEFDGYFAILDSNLGDGLSLFYTTFFGI